VQAGIAEAEHAQHAPKARQRGQPGQLAQRRDREREPQAAQRPVAQAADQGLGRVGAELVGSGAIDQPGQRCEAEQEQQRLRRWMQQRARQRGLHQ